MSAREILSGLPDIRAWQEDLYRDLHAHPELSHAEHGTAARAVAELENLGYDVHSGVGGTGVVSMKRNGDGPVVLLRSELDALPVREDTALPYASTVTTTDADGDEIAVSHACGHDVHMACLLGATRLLAEGTDHWRGASAPGRRATSFRIQQRCC